MTSRFDPRRTFWAVLVGVLLSQGAWLLTLPTFRGIDEFDHVFKAAAVARGEWTNHGVALDGRGALVTIPGSIVRAAEDVCEWYEYTGPDNCRGTRQLAHGDVEVATAASNYNPTYYLLVGTIARPFSGDAANVVMRVVGAVLCALLMAWAAALIARWAATPWPLVLYGAGLTPVFLYSTTVASPNGLTYSGAALVWSALIATSRTPGATRHLAVPAAVGGSVMVTTHTTGAMWLLLITLTALLLLPVRDWLRILLRDRAWWGTSALVVVLATALSSAWVRLQNTNALGPRLAGADTDPLTFVDLLRAHLLWVFQTIAAFPTLNEQAPPVVYAAWLVVLAGVVVLATRRARSRVRIALVTLTCLIVVVPSILTVIAYPHEGIAWQGRYTLPLWIGVALLAGVAVDRASAVPRVRFVPVGFALMAVAMAVSTVDLGRTEVASGPSDPAAAAFPGGFVVVAILSVAGVLLPLVVLRRPAALPEKPDVAEEIAR